MNAHDKSAPDLPYQQGNRSSFARLFALKNNPLKIIAAQKGERFWEYRRQWDQAGSYQLETDYPLELNFELNFSCNLRCPMCLWSAENVKPAAASFLDVTAFRRIVEDGVPRGLASLQFNFLNEPLLRRDLPEFVGTANHAGILDLILHSNGMLLSAQMSERLIDAGLTRLNISLDAFQAETYERIRPGGNLDKVKNNIFDFLAVRTRKNATLPILSLSFVEQKANEGELDKFLEFWTPYADLFNIQNYSNFFRMSSLGNEKEEGLSLASFTPTPSCSQAWQRLVIRYDGSVLPCCSNYGVDLVVGHLPEQSIHEIWNSPKMRQFRHDQAAGRSLASTICRICLESIIPKEELK